MIEISGAVIIKDKKLLVLHKIKSNHFELPGGKIQFGETAEEAMKREVKEEIDCDVEIVEYLGYFDFVHKEKDLRSHRFLVELKNSPRLNEPEEFDELVWMPISDYKAFVLAPNVLNFCENFI